MVRVLFFIHDLMHGGAEKVLVNLVNNLDKSKFEITVMTLFDEGVNKKYLNDYIKYNYIFNKVFRGNTLILKVIPSKLLYKVMIKEEYDIVVSYLEGPCTRIISGCDNNKVSKIAWIHSTESEAEFKYAYKSLKKAKLAYRRFNKIVCVSQDIVENITKLTGIQENIIVKYNTNETDKIKKLSKEYTSIRDINNNYLKVCAMGKVVHNKGFMRLAKVYKRLTEEGYNLEIFILGIGDEQEKIIKYLKKNNIEQSFKFLGYKENPYKYIAACDLFVCSSYKEGFSTAVTESLIVGTPIVSTLCSGAKELLGENNEYGIVVENSEDGIYRGIKKILDNRELLKLYKNKAIERGKLFSKEQTVKAIEELFLEVIKDK